MTTLLPKPAVVSFIPAGMSDAVCEGCGAAIVVYRRPDAPVRCAACEAAGTTPSERFAAESALFELCGHIRALRQGLAPFDVLTPEERQEQLDALLPADGERPVAELSNDELIAIVGDESTPFPRLLAASMEVDKRLKTLPVTPIDNGEATPAEQVFEPSDEPIYVWDGEAPDAATRDELESKIEVPDTDRLIVAIDAEIDGLQHEREALRAAADRRGTLAMFPDEDPRAGSWDSDFYPPAA